MKAGTAALSARPSATACFCWRTARRAASWTCACCTSACWARRWASARKRCATKSTCATSAGLDAAVEEARKGAAQIAFLLKPVSVEQVAATSFAGGVMPQKSTDFYPKLLSGLTIYRLG